MRISESYLIPGVYQIKAAILFILLIWQLILISAVLTQLTSPLMLWNTANLVLMVVSPRGRRQWLSGHSSKIPEEADPGHIL